MRNKSQRPRENDASKRAGGGHFLVLVSFLARSKPKVLFCSETKRKRLLRRLDSSEREKSY